MTAQQTVVSRYSMWHQAAGMGLGFASPPIFYVAPLDIPCLRSPPTYRYLGTNLIFDLDGARFRVRPALAHESFARSDLIPVEDTRPHISGKPKRQARAPLADGEGSRSCAEF